MGRTIRLASATDAAAIADIYAPFVRDTAVSFEFDPPTTDEMCQRIESTLRTHPWLVCDEGYVAGYAYATQHRSRAAYQWSVDVSVYIHEGARRTGAGRALYDALFPILVRQRFTNAYAGITLPNEASAGLHEALGFKRVGVYEKVGFKFGAWHDVGWWQLALQAYEAPAGPPIPFSELPDPLRT